MILHNFLQCVCACAFWISALFRVLALALETSFTWTVNVQSALSGKLAAPVIYRVLGFTGGN